MRKSAVISKSGVYRYLLTRGDPSNKLVFVMLNPSTADAEADDATIRRLIRFSRDWGYPGFSVVNLYALRSRDPKALSSHYDPVGSYNTWYTKMVIHKAETVVVAWGSKSPFPRIAQEFLDRYLPTYKLHHLGLTKDGHPRHPLYLPADTQPVPYR